LSRCDAGRRHGSIWIRPARFFWLSQPMRGFRQAVHKRPVFFRPGTDELSFDEAWLGRLFEAVERKDDDSFRFLIQSRVPRWTQRNLAFLIRSISEEFHRI